jgi:ketosteroid isomerase-like protein
VSQENVEIVRRMFDGWSQGDFSVGRDLVTADFEWRQDAEAVESGSRRGAAIAATFRNLFEVWDDFRVVPERFLDAGDKVVVIAHNRGTGRGSGVELDQAFAYVWTVEAGKLARVEVYGTERDALEAAGLQE